MAPIAIVTGHEDDALNYVSGDWQRLKVVVGEMQNLGRLADTAEGNLKALDKKELWQGTDAEAFRKDLKIVIDVLKLYGKVYPKAATELNAYADALLEAQNKVQFEIIPKAKQAALLSQAHGDEVSAYNTAKGARDLAKKNGADDDCLPPVPDKPGDDPGKKLLREAEEELGKRVKSLTEDGVRCQQAWRKHLDELQGTPDLYKTLKRVGVDFAQGTGTGLLDLAQAAWSISPGRAWTEPGAYFTDLANIAKEMTKPVWNPVGFYHDSKEAVVTTWDEFKKNPARTLGTIAPDVALAVLTRGGIKGKTPRELAEERAQREADASCRAAAACGLVGEPVDAATGEMVLDQVDVSLAGALPLLLSRRHRTHFDRGRCFGPRWASTLDQHLAVHGDGVRLFTADGTELRYPVPEPSVPVMPVGGDRWPLRWDGTPGGEFTVTDPKRGWTWAFAPVAGIRQPILPIRSLTDRNGNRIDFQYDRYGMPSEVGHSGGYRVAVDRDEGRVTGLRLLGTDAATHRVSNDPNDAIALAGFAYDDTGGLAEVVNSSGKPMKFTYDEQHRMTSWTDRNNTWYQYTYDEAGRCVHGVGTDNVLDNTFAYDTQAGVTRMTDALGAVREFTKDRWGRIVAETDPLGNTVRTEWDAFNRKTAVTDERGYTTRFTHDDAGNLVGVVYPDGTYMLAEFDPSLCRPARVIQADGSRRHFAWDKRGNPASGRDELGAETHYTYDKRGNLATVTDALGGVTRLAHDAAGLPISVTNPLGHTTHVTRDAFGRPATVTDPLGHETRMAWTVEGKPAWRELGDGSRESWTWDAEGNLLHHRNAAGFTSRSESGLFDLPIAETGPDGHRYTFGYDPELRLTSVTNPQNLTWTYRYDAAGRLTSETDFNGRTLTYTHDEAGRLATRVNGAAEEVTYARDPFGNVTESVHTATGRVTTYTYDAMSRLTRAINPDVDLTFTRDACGRVLTETSNGRTLTNTYDLLGRRIRRETPAGHIGTWAYDPAGQPTRLETAGHIFDFDYDPAGRETTRYFGNHVTFTQEWDALDRLVAQALAVGQRPDRITAALTPGLGPAETHRCTYDWRPDGYITAVHDTAAGTKIYDLDNTGRVTAVHAMSWTERYAYDNLGNVTHAEWPAIGGTSSEDVQGPRRFTGTLVRRAGRTTYEHDAQGRLIRKIRRSLSGKILTWTFAWDPDDRLIEVVNPSGEVWRYAYDPVSRRTCKKLKTSAGYAETYFTWDTDRLAEQSAGSGESVSWDYAPLSWRPLTQVRSTPSGQTPYAILTGWTGTPTAIIDIDGNEIWRENSAPIWSAGGAESPTPMGQPGQYYDAELECWQNLHRLYDHQTMTYSSADPLGISPSFNHHAYVTNPLVWLDPTGLAPCEAERFRNLQPDDPIVPTKPIPIPDLQRATGKFIYVVMPDGELRVTRLGGNAGHIDLANGQPVIAAGEVKLYEGRIKEIDNKSGHYRPAGASPQAMAEQAFTNSGFTVKPGTYKNKW